MQGGWCWQPCFPCAGWGAGRSLGWGQLCAQYTHSGRRCHAPATALAEPESSAADEARPAAEPPSADFGGLPARERQVAALIVQGQSNRQIAAARVVGVRTVETYVSRILNKLTLQSRVQIATWAIAHPCRDISLNAPSPTASPSR